MTQAEFERYLAAHPHLLTPFAQERRIWISHLPSVQIRSFTDYLGEAVGCSLVCTQMEPELEFVFYDPQAPGNSENELIELAHERAGDLDLQRLPLAL
ncbi:hypothetical protein HW511_01005 [Asaia siamensis]|uniref:Uncharacterized protein n=1 Tax=Asaia siamensis TaxID=110479 RepID=A0ABQ1M6S4_9PROT|nr:hypothetical protein [Asaia siamensis]GBR05991.1 hypothetical protein AA0323_1231 [Asaia siamensis NRIC 0323]GGC35408.1 hypothetical protein GCM10007207_21220 [Asaia siamensis]